MIAQAPTEQERELLAEMPFLVIATALARDTQLCDEEIAAAQRGLNSLDIPELMQAVEAVEHSPTELFELAWLEDDAEASLAERAELLARVYGDRRSGELRAQLLDLAQLVSGASDRPLRGHDRGELLRQVERALGLR